jgi:hypothetical protein
LACTRRRGAVGYKPQGLAQDLIDVTQPAHVLEARGLVPQHLVDLGAGAGQHRRIAQQLVVAKESRPLVVSWPAIRKVTSW